MTAADAERFLAQTLADGKLSGGERQALAARLADLAPDDQLRGVVRHAAFDLARRTVADPVAANVLDWIEEVLRVVAPMSPRPAAAAADDVVLFSPGDACWQRLVTRIRDARRTMDLCLFTITDDRVSNPILDAHRRGVAVRIVTDNEKALDPGSDIHRFKAAGIPVKFDPPHSHGPTGTSGHMHHKFAIFDGARLVNGSYNWTRGAADFNYENLVESADPKLVAAFAAEFDRLWARF